MEFHESQIIGTGEEKKVYQDPENPDRVIGLYHEKAPSPEFVEGRYHLTKIMHLLFPKNIPDIHSSTFDPNAIVRQKVELDEGHKTMQRDFEVNFKSQDYDEKLRAAAEDVKTKYQSDPRRKEMNIAIGNLVDRDWNIRNNGYDQDNNPIFIDSFDPWTTYLDGRYAGIAYNPAKLRNAIANIKDVETRNEAHRHLDRLVELTSAQNTR
jgi:hypothetical protein